MESNMGYDQLYQLEQEAIARGSTVSPFFLMHGPNSFGHMCMHASFSELSSGPKKILRSGMLSPSSARTLLLLAGSFVSCHCLRVS